MWSKKLLALIAVFALAVTACGGATGPTPSPASNGTSASGPGGATPEPTAAPGGGGGAATGGDCVKPGTNTANGSVEGSIVSTGAYSATWTFVVGNNGIGISIGGGSGTIGLTADTEPGAVPGPGADLKVDAAGNIEFGGILQGQNIVSLPPNVGQIFDGSGAQVTFCKSSDETTTPSYLCAVTLDNDVTGSTDSSAKLHLKGTLTIKGTVPTTLGGLTITC